MPESEFLTLSEVRDLTDCARRSDQERVLTELGIPFRMVGRRTVVSRYHARLWLAGRDVTPSREPDLSGVS